MMFPPFSMQIIVTIPGIHCASCAVLIKDVSSEFPSIQNVDVDVDTKSITLEHDESFDLKKWTEEIEALDPKYKVVPLS